MFACERILNLDQTNNSVVTAETESLFLFDILTFPLGLEGPLNSLCVRETPLHHAQHIFLIALQTTLKPAYALFMHTPHFPSFIRAFIMNSNTLNIREQFNPTLHISGIKTV